ncbi:MAG: hypothetical protein H6626_11975 [Pseudobdellovibrionaceae bacterium]|nr:hypothetical protein [Bdellovibrionales bacterium]USN46906.1 MAG: hypothetical protein H6626_11975 [Pseudobdellovibrionaceae bacterium]
MGHLNPAIWIALFVFIFSFQGHAKQDLVSLEEAEDLVTCIGQRCVYRLINPAKFSANDLREAANQALTGFQHQRLGSDEGWVGHGAGVGKAEEVAFWVRDADQRNLLKQVIVSLDKTYNLIEPKQVRLTTQVYVVSEEVLNEFGLGISGYIGGAEKLADGFLPVGDKVTSYLGDVTSNLLRLVFSAAFEKDRAMRLVDRPKIFYSGKSFTIEDKTTWYRDGTISTEVAEAGFELSGVVYVDTAEPDRVAIDGLNISVGLLPTTEETEGSKTGTGVRQLRIPNEYEVLWNNRPRILYDAIVYANFNDRSFGLYTGSRKGGEQARILVIMTAEVDPEDKGEIPHETKQTPDDVRQDLDRDNSVHKNKNQQEKEEEQGFDFFKYTG